MHNFLVLNAAISRPEKPTPHVYKYQESTLRSLDSATATVLVAVSGLCLPFFWGAGRSMEKRMVCFCVFDKK